MNKYRVLNWLRKATATTLIWLSGLSLLVTWGGYLLSFGSWAQKGPLPFISCHAYELSLVAVTALVISLWIRVYLVGRQFKIRFVEKFKGDPRQNWDFVGPWRIAEPNTLLVTGSDEGGLSKSGALWENYDVTLKAKIINQCLGIVLRGQDLNNYYMFQIQKTRIVPHRRVAVPLMTPIQAHEQQQNESLGAPVIQTGLQVGWQVFHEHAVNLSRSLDDWFRVRAEVRGESIRIYIDDGLVLQQESFLKIPTGKIGFRNSVQEIALVRYVKVEIV